MQQLSLVEADAPCERAFQPYPTHRLGIRIVSYGRSKPAVAKLVDHLNRI